MRQEFVESICVFGSVARSRTDCISDKDVLIVADSFQNRVRLTAEWKTKGWSVSAYSPNRFRAMTNSGSLFAQHLKHEGIILSDNDGWLRRTLEQASPKSTYLLHAMDSINLAKPIERFQNDFLLQDQQIVADLAFVSIRNFGINYLAERGELIFDFTEIVEQISRDHRLNTQETELLLSLRAGKAAYRGNSINVNLPGTVADLKELFGKFFPHQTLTKIDNLTPVRSFMSGYMRLRDLEASIISQLGAPPREEDLKRFRMESIWKWITRPQDYSWQVRHFSKRDFQSNALNAPKILDARPPVDGLSTKTESSLCHLNATRLLSF